MRGHTGHWNRCVAESKRRYSVALLVGAVIAMWAFSARHLAAAQEAVSDVGSQDLVSLRGFDPRMIDPHANPCNSLIAFACGKFGGQLEIPADQAEFGIFTVAVQRHQEHLRELMEEASVQTKVRSKAEQVVGDFYASCMDTDEIARQRMSGVHELLEQIASARNRESVLDLLPRLLLAGSKPIVSVRIEPGLGPKRRMLLVVDQASLGLPDASLYKQQDAAADVSRRKYEAVVGKVLDIVVGLPSAVSGREGNRVFELEAALARISGDAVERRDIDTTYNLMSISTVEKLAPHIKWNALLAGIGAHGVSQVNVLEPGYLSGVDQLLANYDVAALKAYMEWALVRSIPSYALPRDMDELIFSFYGQTLKGSLAQQARWRRCVQATTDELGDAVGQLYVHESFKPEEKKAVLTIVRGLEQAMSKDIKSRPWMTEETKARAQAKLQNITNQIGYPNKPPAMSNLEVSRKKILENVTTLAGIRLRDDLSQVGRVVDRDQWSISPAEMSAVYDPLRNTITLPAAMLQPPIYDATAPEVDNYAHIGTIAGHEITHGFDEEGRQFDGKGNRTGWWSVSDSKAFAARTECMRKEYSKFKLLNGVPVNGELTANENIADNGGVRLALEAYRAKAAMKQSPRGGAVDRDAYTPIQRFFIAYGQTWCGVTREEYLRLELKADPHTPRQVRPDGVAENMVEYGRAFSCAVGRPMMPVDPCSIW